MIGNGFDVGIGLKSRFKDFFPIYKMLSVNKVDKIKKFSEDINKDIDTWADFESELGEYTSNFSVDTKQVFIDRLKDFENEFIDYLQSLEDELFFTDNIGTNIKNALIELFTTKTLSPESSNALIEICNKSASQSRLYNFINFNYTNVIENCLDTIPQKVVNKRKYQDRIINDKIGEVVHVHGSCDLYPIIGVNDISQIKNKELAADTRFCQYLVKPTLNKLLRQGNDKKAINIINKSDVICVYGMSLGATDKIWWDLLLRWLYNRSDRQLIIFIYDESFSTSTQFGPLEKENEIIDRLSGYNSHQEIDVEKLRSRIHIVIHKNIFNMKIMQKSGKTNQRLLNKSVEESA